MYQTSSKKSVAQPPRAKISASRSGLLIPAAAAAPENRVPAMNVRTVAKARTWRRCRRICRALGAE